MELNYQECFNNLRSSYSLADDDLVKQLELHPFVAVAAFRIAGVNQRPTDLPDRCPSKLMLKI